MTFAELKAELVARGFQNINDESGGDARIGRFINWGRQRLDNSFLWPYREAKATGVAPLTLIDLGTVELVVNVSQGGYPIPPQDFPSLTDGYWDMGQSGMPAYFYVGNDGGVPVVATVPTSADTIGVQYYRRTPLLVADSDTPLSPADYHLLIVTLATQRAYQDSDNFGAAQALQPTIDAEVAAMVDDLLGGRQIAGPHGSMAVSDASTDW